MFFIHPIRFPLSALNRGVIFSFKGRKEGGITKGICALGLVLRPNAI
jgi:hypothetical protein